MTRTLLLDLDNTLLENDMASFIPAYIELFSRQIGGLIDLDVFVDCLRGSVAHAMANDRPDRTLRETFEEFFLAGTAISAETLKTLEAEFFSNQYPSLQRLTRQVPAAINLVKTAIQRGDRLAVATNPLFPLAAIEQRLAWAGLPREDIPYELVSAIETFHFAKPNPLFFIELLGQIGWPDAGVVMIGDDEINDIQPARALGIPTYWVGPPTGRATSPEDNIHAAGDLGQVLPWLDAIERDRLKPALEDPGALIAVLAGTPATVDSFLRKFAPEERSSRPRPGEWSMTEILCHLRDVEVEVHTPRIERVIREENPLLTGQDTDRWAEQRDYLRQDSKEAFHTFLAARAKNQAMLASLEGSGWDRPARHTIFGPTNLKEIVQIIAGHDRLHLRQIHALCT